MSEGRRIGKYLAERALGAGSFATVWLAYDELLDARVAIKVLADNWARNAGVRQRFVDEARILRKIDHDGIVRVHEINELEDGRPYFVMGWADRGTLHERLANFAPPNEDLPLVTALRLGIEICDALAVVHDFGVVHRDIKPSNILFRSVRTHERIAAQRVGRDIGDEAVMLGDFGLAKDLAAASGFTMAAGTPAYMAPEQAQPTAVIDRRVDVFAVTAVVYEMVAGRPAFASDTLSGVRRSRANTMPDRLSSLRRGLPSALDRIMEQGLARHPDERYSSVIALSTALEHVLQSLGAPAPRATLIGSGPPETPLPPPPPIHHHAQPVGASGRVMDLVSSVRDRIGTPDGLALVAEAEYRLSRPLSVTVVGDGRPFTAAVAWKLFGATPTAATLSALGGAPLRLGRGSNPQAVVTSRTGSAQPIGVQRDRDGNVHLAVTGAHGAGSRVIVTLEREGALDLEVVTTTSIDDPAVGTADVVVVLVPSDAPAPPEIVSHLSATLRRAVAGPIALEALVVPVAGAPPADDVVGVLKTSAGTGALVPGVEVLSDQSITRIRGLMEELIRYRAPLIRAASGLKLLGVAADGATSPTTRAEILEGIETLRSDIPTLVEIELLHDLTSGKAVLPPMLRSDLRRLLLFAQPATRLGLPINADPSTLRSMVEQTGTNWRVLENTGRIPFSARRAMLIAQQSLDRLHSELNPNG